MYSFRFRKFVRKVQKELNDVQKLHYLNWSLLYIDSDYNYSGLILVKCKNMFKKYGDLANYVNVTGNKNYEKFQKERVKYLEFQKPRY